MWDELLTGWGVLISEILNGHEAANRGDSQATSLGRCTAGKPPEGRVSTTRWDLKGFRDLYRAVFDRRPVMNRSAKGGARSSRHYGGEYALIQPSSQGVYERTVPRSGRDPRRARPVPWGTRITDPISREKKWGRMRREQSDSRIVLQVPHRKQQPCRGRNP